MLHRKQLIKLWNDEYPKEMQLHEARDLNEYLAKLESQKHYLALKGLRIVAWASEFVREEEKWFALIVGRKSQHKGLGTVLLKKLKAANHSLSGWVIDRDTYLKANGETYRSPLPFYIKNGFTIAAAARLEAEISALKIQWNK